MPCWWPCTQQGPVLAPQWYPIHVAIQGCGCFAGLAISGLWLYKCVAALLDWPYKVNGYTWAWLLSWTGHIRSVAIQGRGCSAGLTISGLWLYKGVTAPLNWQYQVCGYTRAWLLRWTGHIRSVAIHGRGCSAELAISGLQATGGSIPRIRRCREN